jgi:hypothetical protein
MTDRTSKEAGLSTAKLGEPRGPQRLGWGAKARALLGDGMPVGRANVNRVWAFVNVLLTKKPNVFNDLG